VTDQPFDPETPFQQQKREANISDYQATRWQQLAALPHGAQGRRDAREHGEGEESIFCRSHDATTRNLENAIRTLAASGEGDQKKSRNVLRFPV
jgi:hypothetical protein